jgi:hypothetical protein
MRHFFPSCVSSLPFLRRAVLSHCPHRGPLPAHLQNSAATSTGTRTPLCARRTSGSSRSPAAPRYVRLMATCVLAIALSITLSTSSMLTILPSSSRVRGDLCRASRAGCSGPTTATMSSRTGMGWSTTTGQSTRSWRLRTTRTPARLHRPSIVAWRLRFVATDSNSHPFFF